VENGGEASHCSHAELMFNVPAANLPTWHNLQEGLLKHYRTIFPLGIRQTDRFEQLFDWKKLNDDTADGRPARSRQPIRTLIEAW
jgi:hypothetical protein